MIHRHATRAARLQRIAKVGDAIAKSAELAASERRQNLFTQKERLETVERYCGEYSLIIRDRETSGQNIATLHMYREFSGWLTHLSQNQRNEVAQAEFLLEAALEEVREKRRFADALERAAEKSEKRAVRESRARDQQAMDGLVNPRPKSMLARRLHSK